MAQIASFAPHHVLGQTGFSPYLRTLQGLLNFDAAWRARHKMRRTEPRYLADMRLTRRLIDVPGLREIALRLRR